MTAMTVFIDDATLAAYVDGDLDPAQLREIDRLLTGDRQARAPEIATTR